MHPAYISHISITNHHKNCATLSIFVILSFFLKKKQIPAPISDQAKAMITNGYCGPIVVEDRQVGDLKVALAASKARKPATLGRKSLITGTYCAPIIVGMVRNAGLITTNVNGM